MGGLKRKTLAWPNDFTGAESTMPLFRYVSGGVLPILGIEQPEYQEYYVLFWREIQPVGWNIANGGSETLKELLNPNLVIDREFAEEFIVVSTAHDSHKVYTLNGCDGQPGSRVVPEAWQVWQKRFPDICPGNTQAHPLRVRWIRGTDSVQIKYGDAEPVHTGDYYLNIDAHDFGIEVDRIAKVYMPEGVRLEEITLFDGELTRKRTREKEFGVLDQIVGLFEVKRTNRWFRSHKPTPLLPDHFFRTGRRVSREGKDDCAWTATLKTEMNEYMNQTGRSCELTDDWFNLCPASAGIMKQYLGQRYDVFLSFHSPDIDIARSVYLFLVERGMTVYYYPEANREKGYDTVSESVRSGLDQAHTLVALFSAPSHLGEYWPIYERRAFVDAGKRVFLFGPKVEAKDLPSDIPSDQMRVEHPKGNVEAGLHDLAQRIFSAQRTRK